jgi:outer membrane protein OmpA-like peptidoglycan-associated protein
MKRIGLLACALILGGCGFKAGLVNEPPVSRGGSPPSHITLHRKDHIIGLTIPMTFLIDSVEIYGLWSGEQWEFRLPPDDYVFGYFLGLNECRRLVEIEAGRDYLVTLGPNCVIDVEPVGGRGEIVDSYTIDLVEDEFDFDSARLKPGMRYALDDLARRVRASPGDELLTIVGHTDSVGSREYNYRLGQRRADASKRYLVSNGGLQPSRIRTASAGADNPVATNDTAAGRAMNRRIEIRAELYRRGR